jgi:hypothetical protein
MLKQLVLDMENQLLQVKTQVAIAFADRHLLAKKKGEHDRAADGWKSKAVLAVGKGQDDLARAALDRSLTHTRLADCFAQQLEDQQGSPTFSVPPSPSCRPSSAKPAAAASFSSHNVVVRARSGRQPRRSSLPSPSIVEQRRSSGMRRRSRESTLPTSLPTRSPAVIPWMNASLF